MSSTYIQTDNEVYDIWRVLLMLLSTGPHDAQLLAAAVHACGIKLPLDLTAGRRVNRECIKANPDKQEMMVRMR